LKVYEFQKPGLGDGDSQDQLLQEEDREEKDWFSDRPTSVIEKSSRL
jgi:hypothetical protein